MAAPTVSLKSAAFRYRPHDKTDVAATLEAERKRIGALTGAQVRAQRRKAERHAEPAAEPAAAPEARWTPRVLPNNRKAMP